MSIGSRLEELIVARDTNVNRVARNAGISPQTIYGIIKRDNTKVDINILLALAKELDVTLDYFSGGPIDATELDVDTFVARYRRLDEHGKTLVQAVIDLELKHTLENQQNLPLDKTGTGIIIHRRQSRQRRSFLVGEKDEKEDPVHKESPRPLLLHPQRL